MPAATTALKLARDGTVRRGVGSEIHWNGNAESYWLMGEAMGKSMVELERK